MKTLGVYLEAKGKVIRIPVHENGKVWSKRATPWMEGVKSYQDNNKLTSSKGTTKLKAVKVKMLM